MRKKNLSVRRKKEIFQSVERGGKKSISVEFRVFGKKKEIERKVLRKNQSFFLDENFAKFVFTGFTVKGKCLLSSKKKIWVCVTPLVGHHVD